MAHGPFAAVGSPRPEAPARTGTIRGGPHAAPQPVLRFLDRTAYDVGRIVLSARHEAGEARKPPGVPSGGSGEHGRAT